MATKRASAFQRTRESTPGRSIKCAGPCGKRGDYQHLPQLYSRNPILPQSHILHLHCFQYCVHQLLFCLLHWFVVYHPKTALVYWLVWPRLGWVGLGWVGHIISMRQQERWGVTRGRGAASIPSTTIIGPRVIRTLPCFASICILDTPFPGLCLLSRYRL